MLEVILGGRTYSSVIFPLAPTGMERWVVSGETMIEKGWWALGTPWIGGFSHGLRRNGRRPCWWRRMALRSEFRAGCATASESTADGVLGTTHHPEYEVPLQLTAPELVCSNLLRVLRSRGTRLM